MTDATAPQPVSAATSGPSPLILPGRGAHGLTDKQYEMLLAAISELRVLEKQGQSHVAAFDIDARLTNIFGFGGWDKEIIYLGLVFEDSQTVQPKDKQGNPRGEPRLGWWVTYRCDMRLTIRNLAGEHIKTVEDAAAGSAENLPSRGGAHDFAMKNAVSYALKRCAKDLGDGFGLSLYHKGSLKPVVGWTLAFPPPASADGTVAPVTHDAVRVEALDDETHDVPVDEPEGQVDPRTGELVGPPAAPTDEQPTQIDQAEVDKLRARVLTADTVDALTRLWALHKHLGDAMTIGGDSLPCTVRELFTARKTILVNSPSGPV